jgi:hypothetical protein
MSVFGFSQIGHSGGLRRCWELGRAAFAITARRHPAHGCAYAGARPQAATISGPTRNDAGSS